MIVLDTHVLIWAAQDSRKLGRRAAAMLDDIETTGILWISAMCLWEIAMLDNKGRIELGRDVTSWIDAALALPGMKLAPLDPSIAVDTARLPDWEHRDPVDRMLVATARWHSAPLMTADQTILAYAGKGHVRAIDARR